MRAKEIWNAGGRGAGCVRRMFAYTAGEAVFFSPEPGSDATFAGDIRLRRAKEGGIKNRSVALYGINSLILQGETQGERRPAYCFTPSFTTMSWLSDTLLQHTSVQAMIIICVICALGLSLARIRYKGLSLGVTYVFFMGIAAGALGNYLAPGQELVDPAVLDYVETFGLVLFVYALGLSVGPSFFSAFKTGGTRLNLLAIAVLVLGTGMAILLVPVFDLPFADMMGVLCGATTNTPALGAAQQALKNIGQPAAGAALATAVTYAFGVVGVIFAIILMRSWMMRHEKAQSDANANDETFVGGFVVSNPGLFKMKLRDVSHTIHGKFTVTRLWRNGKVILPTGDTELEEGDRILVILFKKHVQKFTIFFGKRDEQDWNSQDIDWNAIDTQLVSEHVLVTNPAINGRHLSSLHLRNRYGVSVSRVKRADMHLVATPELVLNMGDRLTIVGEKEAIRKAAAELGNTVKSLDEPNMVTIFTGIVLGLLIGMLPLWLPGMSYPVRLGMAGGPIVVGILMGAFAPRIHMVAYTTSSANLMLRSLGLSMYLGCLGLASGVDFVKMVMQPAALLWIAYALIIAIVPLVIVSVYSTLVSKNSFATTAGMLCGAMANPIALNYVNDTTEGDKASVAYATVYPLSMFLRVIIAQVVVMAWFA